MGDRRAARFSGEVITRATPWDGSRWKSATSGDAGDKSAKRLTGSRVPPLWPLTQRAPHGGSDFFNSTVTSDVSAATSGAIVQAAIANNISMIARVNALTLAAR
jgi:hypothetical protein